MSARAYVCRSFASTCTHMCAHTSTAHRNRIASHRITSHFNFFCHCPIEFDLSTKFTSAQIFSCSHRCVHHSLTSQRINNHQSKRYFFFFFASSFRIFFLFGGEEKRVVWLIRCRSKSSTVFYSATIFNVLFFGHVLIGVDDEIDPSSDRLFRSDCRAICWHI